MTVSAFISTDDGYTEKAYIKEVYGVHPAVRIRYRPTPVTDRTQTIEGIRDKSRARDSEVVLAESVAKHLVSWDFIDDNGNSIAGVPAVSKDNVLKLKPALFGRISSIVFYGSEGGDIDPLDDATPEKPIERLEADQKN